MTTKGRNKRQSPNLTKMRLGEMIEQATVDAYGDAEQITGWLTMIEEKVRGPRSADTRIFDLIVGGKLRCV
jgi:hypothetical protein